ncbi:TPA: glutaredoxin family protein [Candidatus Saccharibacteria bacterium]|nr:glutaredoxin family protein [Candidatus Saccharibacteria bacterium]HIO87470.1 glutaredoxin family protein [Candidatus Saccharibacteria bacterium]
MSNIKNITIFSTTTCVYCPMVKKWLDGKGLEYEYIELDKDPSRQQEMIEKSGQMAVPVTLFTKEDGTEEVVVGFNPGQLASAIS